MKRRIAISIVTVAVCYVAWNWWGYWPLFRQGYKVINGGGNG